MMSSCSNTLTFARAFVYAWQELKVAKFHGKVTNFIYFCLVFWLLLVFILCLIFLLHWVKVKIVFSLFWRIVCLLAAFGVLYTFYVYKAFFFLVQSPLVLVISVCAFILLLGKSINQSSVHQLFSSKLLIPHQSFLYLRLAVAAGIVI